MVYNSESKGVVGDSSAVWNRTALSCLVSSCPGHLDLDPFFSHTYTRAILAKCAFVPPQLASIRPCAGPHKSPLTRAPFGLARRPILSPHTPLHLQASLWLAFSLFLFFWVPVIRNMDKDVSTYRWRYTVRRELIHFCSREICSVGKEEMSCHSIGDSPFVINSTLHSSYINVAEPPLWFVHFYQ